LTKEDRMFNEKELREAKAAFRDQNPPREGTGWQSYCQGLGTAVPSTGERGIVVHLREKLPENSGEPHKYVHAGKTFPVFYVVTGTFVVFKDAVR